MARYITRRLLWMIPVLLGVVLVVFCIRAITPGDPVDSLLSEDATEEQRAELRHELGLDRPLPVQFLIYVKNVFTGDLGTSYTTKQPVLRELLNRLPTTMIICFSAVFIGIALGIPLGIFSAVKQYTWVDSVILVLSMVMRSIPGFCLAFFLISLFSVKLGWLPAVGITNPLGYIMPMCVIGLGSMAGYTRMTRSSMLETIRQDYIRTARAKGQTEPNVIMKHAFRNAAVPLVASIGNQISRQLGGALILETVFGIPGIGKYIGDAVSRRNFPVVQGGVIFLAFVFCLMNLLIDLGFMIVNPRLKTVMLNSKPLAIEKYFHKLRNSLKKNEKGAATNE